MIGGTDFVIPATSGETALDLALRCAFGIWPNAIVEDAETGDTFHSYYEACLNGRRELLVYKDEGAAKRWDEMGAVDELSNTMIQLFASDRGFTIIVDSSPSEEMLSYVKTVRNALRTFGSKALVETA